MRRTALALTLILALLFLMLAGKQLVDLAGANPIYAKPTHFRISVQSPQNSTYNTQPIFLNFTVETNEGDFNAHPYFYLLDGENGQSSVKIEEIQVIRQREVSNELSYYAGIYWDPYTEYTLRGQAVLPNLSDGEHNVTVFIDFLGNQTIEMDLFALVPFTIYNTSQSEIQEPSSTTLVIVSIASVAVIGASLLVYVRKRNHYRLNKHREIEQSST
jgi:hypothetical protein